MQIKIKKGSHRVTILTRSLAIKFPRILRPLDFLRKIIKCVKKREFDWARSNLVYILMKFWAGIRNNWDEFKCWRELRADFLTPTYFSLFGLVNIQKLSRGKAISWEEMAAIWTKIIEETGGAALYTQYHDFANPENYHRFTEGLKLFDYGGARKFIGRHKDILERIMKEGKQNV